MTEALAYKMQPAGHEEPEKRKSYERPDKSLCNTFEQWLEMEPDWYHLEREEERFNQATDLVKDLTFSQDQVHALLIQYQDHPRVVHPFVQDKKHDRPWEDHIAWFLSACYNKVEDRDIIFNIQTPRPLDQLGYKLAKGKRLINFATIGDHAMFQAEGDLINYGKAGVKAGQDNGYVLNYASCPDELGCGSKGPVINFGNAGHSMGSWAKGPVINFGRAGSHIGHNSYLTANCGFVSKPHPISGRPKYSQFVKIWYRYPEGYKSARREKTVRPSECMQMPELRDYLENLYYKLKPGKTDYKAAAAVMEEYGPEPGKKMQQDILSILKRAGRNV